MTLKYNSLLVGKLLCKSAQLFEKIQGMTFQQPVKGTFNNRYEQRECRKPDADWFLLEVPSNEAEA